MRAATDSDKSMKQLLRKDSAEGEELEIPDVIRYYRKRNPEEDQAHTLGSELESSVHKIITLPTEPEESRPKEIHGQKWSEGGWLDTKRSSLIIDTNGTGPPGTNDHSAIQSPLRQKSMHLSALDTNKEEEPPLRLSITEKVLKEYRDKLKIHRTKSNGRRLKTPTKSRILSQSVAFSQEMHVSDGLWASDENQSRMSNSKRRSMDNLSNLKHLSPLNTSQSITKPEFISPASGEYFLANGAGFRFRLHHVLSPHSRSVERNPSLLKNIAPVHPKADSNKSSESIAKSGLYKQIQSRQALLNQVDESKLRERINSTLNGSSRWNLERKESSPGKLFYNQMITTNELNSSSFKREKSGSPINLRLREKLNEIKRLAMKKNQRRTEGSIDSEKAYDTEGRVLSKTTLNEIFDSPNTEESVRTTSALTPTKLRHLRNDSPIQPRPSDSMPRLSNGSQSTSLPKIGVRSELETPIRITDQTYGGGNLIVEKNAYTLKTPKFE